MIKKENELFFELCKFKKPNKEKLESLIKENATSPLLGELFFNRMQGVAYGILKNNNLLGSTNREFRNALRNAHGYNVRLNDNYYECIDLVSRILRPHKGKYAMLKGALLCKVYPEGYRTSNDVDLLVRPSDVTIIGTALANAGFMQGNIRNGEFSPATRKEIIESKMMRGETVPYILEVNLPFMRFLEVDINFSLDFKNDDAVALESMLCRTVEFKIGNSSIMTLNKYDFFIHLCCHLYKEATTLPWIRMKRDMSLYKFADIYLLLDDFAGNVAEQLFFRASELGALDICSCVIKWTCVLFDIEENYLKSLAEKYLKNDDSILQTVVAPSEKKTYFYSEFDIKERFFCNERILLLKEVNSDAKT